MHTNFSRTRQFFALFLVIAVFTLLFIRLYYLQIICHAYFSDMAESQHKKIVNIDPLRGLIYDRNDNILALNVDVNSVYAVSRVIRGKKEVAEKLSGILRLERADVLQRLGRDKAFVWIKRKIDTQEADAVKKSGLEGIELAEETRRFYPGSKLACHLLGFVDIDNKGLEGIELQYDEILKGKQGWRISMLDAKRRDVASLGDEEGLPSINGYNLKLTVDEVIQDIVEREIERLEKSTRAKGVTVIVMEPGTGAILAMANYPWFDLNSPAVAGRDMMRNRAIADCYEPGSVFKIVTASAALEEGVVDFDKEFYCENGEYKIGSRVLHDYRPYGNLTFREVIEKSSNIGVAKVAQLVGEERLYSYIRRFGFGLPTGVDLPGEIGGISRPPSKWSRVDITTIPMGQGISVSALQLVSAISAIANDGAMMRPFIVSEMIDEKHDIVMKVEPRESRQVISRETAGKMKEILKGVVDTGSGRKAKPDDYTACGKTGTAQKASPDGGYYSDRYVASFIGFAPAEDPKIAMVVTIDEPKGLHFGGQIAAPAFKNIADKVLRYLELKDEG